MLPLLWSDPPAIVSHRQADLPAFNLDANVYPRTSGMAMHVGQGLLQRTEYRHFDSLR